MYRFLSRSGLAACAFLPVCAATAQPAPESETAPSEAPADDISSAEFDPAAPFSEIPEIEDDWSSLNGSDNAEQRGEDAAFESPAPVRALRYTFDLKPITGHGILRDFRAFSALVAGSGKPVPSLAELNRRTRVDEDLVRRLLRAKGYYDPDISFEIAPAADNGRLSVIAQLEIGPLYTIDSVNIDVVGGDDRALTDRYMQLKPGDPVEASAVNAARAALAIGLAENGFPFAKVGEPEIVVDHQSRTASYTLSVTPGPSAVFGEIRVVGDPIFSAKHVGRLARFGPGDTYDSGKVNDLRQALVATSLIGSVDIRPVQSPGTGAVDLEVKMTPAPMRTISGQIGFSTEDGIRTEASWQHRNLIRPQGAVAFRIIAGTEEQRLTAELRRSNWKRRDRTLGARLELSREDRDAFFARSVTANAYIERETNLIWQKKWVYRFGPEFVASQERDRSGAIGPAEPVETFFIAAFPGLLAYDGTDDLLDPKRGFRLSGRASPELSLQDGAFGYLKTQIDASTYLPLAGDDLVLAGRVRVGTIFGASRERIAPSRRFYAGGGGSVRGYGLGKIGALDADNDPLGGRSITEFSVEARYRFGNFGVVPFIDAGQVDTSEIPRFKNLRFGVGIGARYYTNFGPIRLDIATPINKRDIDPRVAVYVSIGQSF